MLRNRATEEPCNRVVESAPVPMKKFYLSTAINKVGARNRTEAAQTAQRQGWL